MQRRIAPCVVGRSTRLHELHNVYDSYVAKVFSPDLKAQALDMVTRIEQAMRH